MSRRTLPLVLLMALAAACGPTQVDLGIDAAVTRPDAEGPDLDASPGEPDAGGPRPDAGVCDVPTCQVELSYPRGSETSVEVRGDFAPDGWEVGVPMAASGSTWTATVPIADEQVVQYKFVVDGTTWVTDPANPKQVPDGFGGVNSLVRAECGGCPREVFDWRDGILYFVLVDRFENGDPSNDEPVSEVETPANYQGGDLAGVLVKIEEGYFDDLGVNVLWLSAPIDNADGSGVGDDGHDYSAYHGYWPSDLVKTEARVGDLDDLRAVVDAAHAHGIRVLLDYVMNHVHAESPVYAEHPDWFWPLDGCVCGQGCSWDTEPDRLRCWFRDYLPDFNFQNDWARNFSVGNAIWWVHQAGVDGYRLDAVKHIETSWLLDLRARLQMEVDDEGQTFYLVGETYTGDRDLIKQYVSPPTMLDGQFDFPLRAELVRTLLLRQGSLADLAGFLDGNDGFYGDGAVMGTFVGNHDLPRAIHFAEDSPQFTDVWDSGKARAWWDQPQLPGGQSAFERLALAYTFLMTTQGMPLLYYGDEIGMAGAGDPDNRRFMQWEGLSSGQTWLRERVSRLAHIRAAHPATRRGTRTTLAADGSVLVYRMEGASDRVFVAINRSDGSAPATGLPAGEYVDLLTDTPVTAPANIPARSALVLVEP